MAKKSRKKAAESAPKFDEAFASLQAIVERLEEGTVSLEESLADFETGVGLLKTCTRILDEAERRIEVVTGFSSEGEPRTKPFDASATHESEDAIAKERTTPESEDERDHSTGGGVGLFR